MTPLEIQAELQQFQSSDKPIIVGPWMSEIGFELLYWIPFLRHALSRLAIDPSRLWMLSRGGCRSWYADLSSNYLDLFDGDSAESIARMNQRRIAEQAERARTLGLRRRQRTAKQYGLTPVELELIDKARKRAGLKPPMILHPSLMYRTFRAIWRNRPSDLFDQWQQFARPARITAPECPIDLPERFVAVKFYSSQACLNLPGRALLVQKIVRELARQIDVVLLHTGTAYDDHGEFHIPHHTRIHRLQFPVALNLEWQTAILARAEGLVGTYGGFAYLAPFLGVNATAFYGTANFRIDHLRLVSEVARRHMGVSFRASPIGIGVRSMRDQWVAHAA